MQIMNPEAFVPPQAAPERLSLWQRAAVVGTAVVAFVAGMVNGAEASPSDTIPHPHPAVASEREGVEDTLPTVARDANYKDPQHTRIHNHEIATLVDAAITSHRSRGYLPAYKEPGKVGPDGTTGLSVADDKYSTLLTITFGKDKQLHYRDKTLGVMPEGDRNNILGAVAANTPMLTAAMETGKLQTVNIHMYKPTKPGEIPPISNGMDMPDDQSRYKSGRGESSTNLELFLNDQGDMDQESLATLVSHESIHAALKAGLESGKLSPEDLATITKACGVLRHHTTEFMHHFSRNITDQLRYLRQHVDKQYAPAFTKVMEAIQQGTYDQLPIYKGASEVPECYIQSPIAAVYNVADTMDLDSFSLAHKLGQREFSDQIGKLNGDWHNLSSYYTIYKLTREETYLSPEEYNKDFGHPQDNSDETFASFLDVALQFPDKAAAMISTMTKSEQKATLAIVQTTANILKKNNPDNTPLKIQLDIQLDRFKTALNLNNHPNTAASQPGYFAAPYSVGPEIFVPITYSGQ